MKDNRINFEGSKRMAELLEVNQTIRELNLNQNKISVLGFKRIGQALKINSGLKILSVKSNDISDNGVRYLEDAMKYNNSLRYLFVLHDLYNYEKNLTETGFEILNKMKVEHPNIYIGKMISSRKYDDIFFYEYIPYNDNDNDNE